VQSIQKTFDDKKCTQMSDRALFMEREGEGFVGKSLILHAIQPIPRKK
jgi:hypothetical protein